MLKRTGYFTRVYRFKTLRDAGNFRKYWQGDIRITEFEFLVII